MMQFHPATKERAKARVALIGPSGSGKTYTALLIAHALGERVAVLDTEHGSASKYADEFAFDTLELDTFGPMTYVAAIQAAEQAGYDVLIIDSLSHAWAGKDGALEQVDKAAKKYKNNSYAAWRDVTPKHNKLIDAMVGCDCHLIVTMRAKTAYEVQKSDNGKMQPVKIGLAPVQRDGMEYEFDVVADMDLDHNLIVSKTRCPLLDGEVIARPDGEVGKTLLAWLTDGTEPQTIPTGGHDGGGDAGSPAPVEDLPANGGQAAQGTGPQRPAAPEMVRGWLIGKAAKSKSKARITDKQLKLVTWKLHDACVPYESTPVIRYVFGAESYADLTKAQAGALLDWLIDDGEYHPDALIEAKALAESQHDGGKLGYEEQVAGGES